MKSAAVAIVVSWLIAFVEYRLQVPANRLGHGTYSAAQLKTMQEVITLCVFCVFSRRIVLKEPPAELLGRFWPDGFRCFVFKSSGHKNVQECLACFPIARSRMRSACLPSLCVQKPRWFIQRFVAQLETSPSASGQSAARAQLTKRNHRLLGIDVLWAHKPARCIRPMAAAHSRCLGTATISLANAAG